MFSGIDESQGIHAAFADIAGMMSAPAYGLPAPERHRLLIGVEGPMSGSQKDTGRDLWRGVKLAAREINKDGGLLGYKISLIKANDKADPERALPVARKLKRRGAVAVIGPYNSGVGIVNLPYYTEKGIIPVHLTSTDETSGLGATVQPKNSQIAPTEVAYMLGQGVQTVSMLVDPAAFTVGMADRVRAALEDDGVAVQQFLIDPAASDYSAVIATALAGNPDLVYVSTYYPQGALIAKGLESSGTPAQRFMGLANVDPQFVQSAGLEVAQTCVFSGVPAAGQLPTAAAYTSSYESHYKRDPGVWGVFGYDSLFVLKQAMEQVRSTAYGPALDALLHTDDYLGQTGVISIDPLTGNRIDAPVYILEVDDDGVFVIV